MTNPISYDINFILRTIVNFINDITLRTVKIKYVYVDDDVSNPKRYDDPSKSYLYGKLILPGKLDGSNIISDNTVYLTYLLDPNIAWGEPDRAKMLYATIDEYILSESRKGLLKNLHIEILRDQKATQQYHEHKSDCRSEDTIRYLYEDTVGLWTPILSDKTEHNYDYYFIRSSEKYHADKNRVYLNTGKKDYSDYVAEVKNLNDTYDLRVIDNVKLAFDEYKQIYYNYFGYYPFEEGDDGIQTAPFRLLNWTDYSIKDKINNRRV